MRAWVFSLVVAVILHGASGVMAQGRDSNPVSILLPPNPMLTDSNPYTITVFGVEGMYNGGIYLFNRFPISASTDTLICRQYPV
jgi:hypothetical protein